MQTPNPDLDHEQCIVDDWKAWAAQELPNRRHSADRAYKRALAAGDEAAWQHAEIMERSYGQLAEMITHQDPYFARIRGQMRDPDGEIFEVDLRVHRYHRSETFPSGPGEVLDISHLAPLADLVRNPRQHELQITLTEREFLQWRGTNPRIEVIASTVEDIEVDNGQVLRVAPRYGAIFEDRVRRRLKQSALPALDILADVLDEQQNAIVGNRSRATKLLVLDGPAGTGKTVVAAHRVAVAESPNSPGLYLTPTTTLRDYVNPVLPRLGLDRGRAQAVSVADLAAMMWPDLPWSDDLAGPIADPPCSSKEWLSCVADARRGHPTESWERIYRRASAAVGHQPASRFGPQDAALLLALGAAAAQPRPVPEPHWIIVDEAQAVPLMVFQALSRWLGGQVSWVAAGDLMQQGSRHNWDGWKQIQKALGLTRKQSRVLWLNRSYRVPPRIHAAAERLRLAVSPKAQVSESVPWHPHPGEVSIRPCADAYAAIDLALALILDLTTTSGLTSVAVMAPDASSLRRWQQAFTARNLSFQLLTGGHPYQGGLALTELENVRGLEFDAVILLNCDASSYPDTDGAARQLYTSLTRARRQAHLLYDGPPSPWLAVLRS
jgi:hypothetical protein